MDRQGWLDGTLYRPDFEQDSCGFGLMANMDDKPSHWLVQTAINSLACLTHRGAVAADGKSGDGCGLLFKKRQHLFELLGDVMPPLGVGTALILNVCPEFTQASASTDKTGQLVFDQGICRQPTP